MIIITDHPNKEQFQQYEQQWKTYERQMEAKREEIQQKKQACMNQQSEQTSQLVRSL